MNLELKKAVASLCGMFVLLACTSLGGETRSRESAQRTSSPPPATPADVVQYVRDRFGVPENVRVDAQPLRQSRFSRLYQTSVTTDNGQQKRVTDVFITPDALCFVVGNVFALDGASKPDIVRGVREAAKLAATAKVTVGHFANSAFPDFLKATVTAQDGTRRQTGELFVTRDLRTGVIGTVVPFQRDFVERLINTRDQPSVGPADAPVTIVEYADFECPSCAYFQKFLETEFLSRYGSKVRIVFKEFPISSHPWSTTAAVANECVYQIAPSKFFNYRNLIFGNREIINPTNVRQQLLRLGAEAGLDEVTLSRCLDSEASLGRIEKCREEAKILGIFQTPTFFVNGRIVVGVPPGPAFYAIVDQAMGGADARR
jgi:protein-disulfide isomerase